MAVKMIDKKECEYKGGYIICNGEVVAIDNEIVDLFNKLEEDVQRAYFEKNNCGEMPCYRKPEVFQRVTEHGKIYPTVTANTPELDKAAEKTLKLMEEYDSLEQAEKANAYFAGITPLFQFVSDDFIVSAEHGLPHRFDLPVLGNPIEMTLDKLSTVVMSMFGSFEFTKKDDEDGEQE